MGKIEGIQALRAFAAISVILTHMSFIDSGSYGVDIFFVISGFLMMHSTENGFKDYWKKKLFRIVPFYWIMTAATAVAVTALPNLFHSYEVSGSYLLKSLFFIPYAHHGIAQPVLGLGYTLNYEMLFYLLFYVASRIAAKRKYADRGWICIALLIGLVALKALRLPMPFQFWCNFLMLDFMLGILLHYAFQAIDIESFLRKKTKQVEWICGICIGFVVVFLWEGVHITASEAARFFVWGMLSAALFVLVYIFSYRKKMPAFFILVGNISYYIYLTHPYCVRLTENIGSKLFGDGALGHIAMALIAVGVSILCGYMVSFGLKGVGRMLHSRCLPLHFRKRQGYE